MPDPIIKKPFEYFNVVTYTGTGSAQTISGVGFQPDFVWIKPRSFGGSPVTGHNTLYDAVRGATKELYSDLTSGEATNSQSLTAFTSDGFSVGTEPRNNASGQSYVAWCWKANGTGVTNTAGSITSTVSANTSSGFSVVTYTGTGANATVGHGLGVAPKMVIVKSRSSGSENWLVYNSNLPTPATDFLLFNTSAANASLSNYWNGGTTSTIFGLGNYSGINGSGATYVAYCFSEVQGYSKFGSYTGNGSADGTFVFTGFRPRYVLVKSTTNGTRNWNVLDTARDTTNAAFNRLFPNLTVANNTDANPCIDINANGFKIRTTDGDVNQSGGNYIFMAFAESPFKYANAR